MLGVAVRGTGLSVIGHLCLEELTPGSRYSGYNRMEMSQSYKHRDLVRKGYSDLDPGPIVLKHRFY